MGGKAGQKQEGSKRGGRAEKRWEEGRGEGLRGVAGGI